MFVWEEKLESVDTAVGIGKKFPPPIRYLTERIGRASEMRRRHTEIGSR